MRPRALGLWAKIFFHCLRHTGWWRLAWASAIGLGLLGWELALLVESHTHKARQATALTLLFKPGVGESDIHPFLKTLPPPQSSILREPAHVWADAQRFLAKLGHFPEELGLEGVADIGFAAELHWRGLSAELAKQLRIHLEKTSLIEQAYWATPLPQVALPWLRYTLFAFFSLSMGLALGALSLGCFNEEAQHLRVLLGLGASLRQVRAIWFAQGLLWAALAGACAYIGGQLAVHLWGSPEFSIFLSALVAQATALGAAGALLAWLIRGHTCWA
ncbi:MAG: hypothetical protein FWG75_02420 [Cystobacterineae bacterium]|nr:hypothetical protein [Cystobacterineae bacterium]